MTRDGKGGCVESVKQFPPELNGVVLDRRPLSKAGAALRSEQAKELPIQFQGNFHDSWPDSESVLLRSPNPSIGAQRTGNTTEAAGGGWIGAGKAEVGSVEGVEHFPAELYSIAFSVRKVLVDAQVAHVDPWALQHVSRGAAKGSHQSRLESRSIEVPGDPLASTTLIHIERLACQVCAFSADVRPGDISGTRAAAGSPPISARDAKGYPGLKLPDAAEFPITQDSANHPVCSPEGRSLVHPAGAPDLWEVNV